MRLIKQNFKFLSILRRQLSHHSLGTNISECKTKIVNESSHIFQLVNIFYIILSYKSTIFVAFNCHERSLVFDITLVFT